MPKLYCKKHNRILIGKTKCIDCVLEKGSKKLEKQIVKHIDVFKRLANK